MTQKNNLIFVSIAAYRDPELLPTLRDMFSKAKYPDLLRIGICWQKTPEESNFVMSSKPFKPTHSYYMIKMTSGFNDDWEKYFKKK